MIVNPYSVSALTIDTVSFGLALAGFVKTIRQIPGCFSKTSLTGELITKRENQLYLLFWLGTVLLFIRLLSWPFFYLVLHSFVPGVTGAMCIFGATKLLPALTLFLEIIKPLLFFLGMLWLFIFGLERLNRRSTVADGGAVATMLVLLLICTLTALVESGGSVILWVKSSAELAVSCCTTITDIPNRFTVWVPESLLGSEYEYPLLIGYYTVNTFLVVLGGVTWVRLKRAKIAPFQLFLLSVSSLLAAGVTLLAMIELIAPDVMGLSFHHCLYCFVQETLDGALILVLLLIGSFLFAVLMPVYLLAKSWTERRLLESVFGWCLGIGIICLSGSLVMVSVHLLL